MHTVSDQVAQDHGDRTLPLELFEDGAHNGLHLLVGIEVHFAQWPANITDWHKVDQLSQSCLLHGALVHALLENVLLGFRHRAFQAEQEAVIVARGIVQPVKVADKRAEEGAQFEELIPVLANAGQP